MREAGDSVGAVGFGAVLGAVLVESWAKRLTEPSPTMPAANRIRPSEDKGRECMRLSSATTGKSFKKLKVIQTKLTSQLDVARPKNNCVTPNQTLWRQQSTTRES